MKRGTPSPRLYTLVLFALALIALLVSAAPRATASPSQWFTPPTPVAFAAGAPQGTPGAIYYGTIPPGGGTNKPVLVFVHGNHGQAQDWWNNTRYYGRNDMYDYAYNYGYRTAFVDMLDSNGTGASMWTNGQLLRSQLDAIASHYGVSSLNVVAHSKGGVDMQAAIVHYGAGPRVQKLFTLDTPHWGTQTADLCYSTWTWWLAALLGQRDDGSYVMQTGYMSYFRSITDNRPENGQTHYYTGGGTSWGPLFSAMWWGGSYLNFYGQNDGLVTVTSAHNPLATHVFTRALDHDNVRMGRNVFPTVDTYVSSLWRGTAPDALERQPAPAMANPLANSTASSILRGGPISPDPTASTTDQVPVESGATHLALDLLSNSPTLDLVWTAPGGKTYTTRLQHPQPDQEGYFKGGYHYVVDVDAPAPGSWRMAVTDVARQPATSAYLLVANISSPLTLTVSRDPALTFAPGSSVPIEVSAADASGRTITALQLTADVTLDGAGHPQIFAQQGSGDTLRTALPLPAKNGIANLSITFTGLLSDGNRFERSIATSVPVVARGTLLPFH